MVKINVKQKKKTKKDVCVKIKNVNQKCKPD